MIPAQSTLFISLSTTLLNEEVFKDSGDFNPDRYFSADQDMSKQHTIPFGMGEKVLTKLCALLYNTYILL